MNLRRDREPEPPTERLLAGSALHIRALARRVHFLAGILVAPLVLLLCLTGLVYVFSPQIHADLYASQLFVHEVGSAPRPVAGQVAAALSAHPEAELRSVLPPPEPDRTTRVNLAVPGLTEPGEARTVFVDPYTDRISGELTTVEGRMPANVWLRDLHSDLHLGAVGRLYSEVAASWLPVILVSGLVLWIAKQGRRRRGIRELLTPLPRGSGEQTRMRAVHGPLGIWLTAGLLVMSGTGLAMSRFAGWGLPAVQAPELAMAPVTAPGNVVAPIGVDRALEVARAEGLSGEVEVTVPIARDQPYRVAETATGVPIQKDAVAVDPYTGQVTERVGWDDYPFLAQLREIGVQAHTGTLYGLTNQIVLALLVIATIVLIVIGYRMWWKRSPYQQEATLPPIPPPAMGRLNAWVAVPVVLVTAGLGWLLPAFGISLLALVAVDLVINAVRQPHDRLRRTAVAGALLAAGTGFGAAVLINAPAPVTRIDAVGTAPGPPALGSTAPEVGEPPAVVDPAAPFPPPSTRGGTPPRPVADAGSLATTPPEAPGAGPEAGDRTATNPGSGDRSDDGPTRAGASRTPDPDPQGDTRELPNGAGAPAAVGTPQPEPNADSPGLVTDLVGRLSDTAEPVTSFVIDAVDDLLLGR